MTFPVNLAYVSKVRQCKYIMHSYVSQLRETYFNLLLAVSPLTFLASLISLNFL